MRSPYLVRQVLVVEVSDMLNMMLLLHFCLKVLHTDMRHQSLFNLSIHFTVVPQICQMLIMQNFIYSYSNLGLFHFSVFIECKSPFCQYLQGLKVLDNSVENFASGAWQALGSAWKGSTNFVQKYVWLQLNVLSNEPILVSIAAS